MGQREVLEWFNKQSKCGMNDFVTIKQVYKKMNQEGYKIQQYSVWRSMVKLKESGLLIMKHCNIKSPIRYKLNNNSLNKNK